MRSDLLSLRPLHITDPFTLNDENAIKVIKKEDNQTYIRASTTEN